MYSNIKEINIIFGHNNENDNFESIIDKAFIEWSDPKYACPKCGGGMRKNLQHCICLASYPPQYRYTYKCDKCDYTEELGV